MLATIVHAATIGADVKTGVCLFRFEDGGFLNIYPAQLRIDGKPFGGISGGAYRCFDLTPGSHVAEAVSANPHDHQDTASNAWRSKKLHFVVAAGTKVFLEVWPGSRSSTYVGPWRLKVSDIVPDSNAFPQSWHLVPGFNYIQVDGASIHRERPPPPARPLHLRPPDTTVDINIDGRTYPQQKFWCVPRGEVTFNARGTSWSLEVWPPNPYPGDDRVTKAAMEAVEHVVCVDMEVGQ